MSQQKNYCEKLLSSMAQSACVPLQTIFNLELETCRQCLTIVEGYTKTNCSWQSFSMKEPLIKALEERIYFLENRK